ncbi:uncharacterized protein EI90DRAFT_3122344 [Cantharellus anzutake]|uniref:uncharacterized protein n=1 Tax=Cantharellus anzutake TaxID=1750568 RepID=UPI0019061FBE|nr:uncharacterized protein EI90DRAFT_3122344 [Cantharellus anzutake]KAF8332582.1 hypothetical protein EI90DRAFT_3122344 [Cantharellus anzutake]
MVSSRHRFVRNLDISEELLADPVSSDEYDDAPESYPGITPEQKAQMDSGLVHVRSLLGPEILVSDRHIREALWDSYFDVDGTVDWFLTKHEEDRVEAERQEKEKQKALVREAPPLSALQRLSLASRDNRANKDKVSLASLARKTQSSAVSSPLSNPLPTPKTSLQSLAAISKRPIPSPSASRSPTSSLPSLLAQKSAVSSLASQAPVFSTSSVPAARQSKLAQKVLKSQAASKSIIYQPPLSHTSPSVNVVAEEGVEIESSPAVKHELNVFSITSSSGDGAELQAFNGCAAVSISEFASILVQSPLWSHLATPPHKLNPSNSSDSSQLRGTFMFNSPSPDDIRVFYEISDIFIPVTRAKAAKAAKKSTAPSSSPFKKPSPQSRILSGQSTTIRFGSMPPSSTSSPRPSRPPSEGPSSPRPSSPNTSGISQDVSELSLTFPSSPNVNEEPVALTYTQMKLIEEARQAMRSAGKVSASMIVIGHVDAGKSTLMGRMLYELGRLEEKQRIANERASDKMGKSSFSWAWGLDALGEERERLRCHDGYNANDASVPKVNLTILDAPGHRDFVPNLISGASQADTALLVVGAAIGEFEAGFQGGGQTREHVLLVRSLGVSSLIVAINKLDLVDWSQSRFEEICNALRPFLTQSGFQLPKVAFVPCAAMKGVNLTENNNGSLKAWHEGQTLAEILDRITPPSRDIEGPIRFPVSNVFRGGIGSISAGLGVSGRLCTGVLQVGEKLRVLPGDETATVRKIEVDEESQPWVAAGTNATLYLSGIEWINIGIGSILCPSSSLVPLVSNFVAQIIVFDISLPITPGTTIELFHQSRDMPATITKLIETIDRATGVVIKTRPRVITKNASAKVQISLKATSVLKQPVVPLELFVTNKELGRVLLRRAGETIAAGIVIEITP